MKRCFILLFLLGAIGCFGWSFNGINERKTLVYRPAPGRFALTMAFRMNVPWETLTPGRQKGTAFYPMVMNGVRAGKDDFKRFLICFVVKPDNRYFFATAGPGGRYNISWNNAGSEIPTGKPVWIFLSAAAGGIFEARINGRNYSQVRSVGLVPLVNSAPEYRITLGCNPYRGGTGYTKCTIDNFMLFERVLSTGEMEAIEKDPGSVVNIPGYFKIAE